MSPKTANFSVFPTWNVLAFYHCIITVGSMQQSMSRVVGIEGNVNALYSFLVKFLLDKLS